MRRQGNETPSPAYSPAGWHLGHVAAMQARWLLPGDRTAERFGGFFDSVLDRYSDLALFMGLLVYYASINRFFYIVLTAIVMTGSVTSTIPVSTSTVATPMVPCPHIGRQPDTSMNSTP